MKETLVYQIAGQYPVKLMQAKDGSFGVEYGSHRPTNLTYTEAAQELGGAIMHAAACADLIVTEDD